MAKIPELEAQLLKWPADLKPVRALLLDPEHRSDSALPYLSLALWNLAAAAQRADVAFLARAAKKTKAAWPDTWMRTWLIASMASTSALILRLLDGPSKPVKVALPAKAHARWLAIAGAHDFSTLDGLLDSLLDGPATQIAERVQALLGWPKDARIAKAALAAHRGKLVSNAMHPIWNALGNAIAVHADASLRKEIVDLAGPHQVSLRQGGRDPAPRRELPKKQESAEGLEAWAMAAPGDLGRRAAWADWLLEQGDPRGELMSLQLADRALTPAETRRVAALVKKHGKEWIGKLRGVADAKHLTFARGVLVGMRVNAVADARVAEDPGWAHIEALSVPDQQLAPRLEAKILDCVPRLRALEGPAAQLLRKVLRLDVAKLERLSFDYGFHRDRISNPDLALLQLAELWALRALRVGGQPSAEVVRQLIAMPWFGKLERLTVTGLDFAERFARVAQTTLPRLDVLSYRSQGWEPGPGVSFSATRVGSKWKLDVTGLPDATRAGAADFFHETDLLPVLGRLPTKTFTEVTMQIQTGSPKVAKKIEAQLQRICG